MIHDFPAVRGRIHQFRWTPTDESYLNKVQLLASAIQQSTFEAASQFPGEVHLALSGGVDSALLLSYLVKAGCQVVAHTIFDSEDHQDRHHASLAASSFGEQVVWRPHLVKRGNPNTDNYIFLMREVGQETSLVMCGDCIDEMTGGYYSHQADQGDFQSRIERLVPEHLISLEKASTQFQVTVHLPYASAGVMDACGAFTFDELVDGTSRKKPIYRIASRERVPTPILIRRKLGLVSAV